VCITHSTEIRGNGGDGSGLIGTYFFPKKHVHTLDRALWNCYLPLNQKKGIYWDDQVLRFRFSKEPEVKQVTFTFSRSWEPQSPKSL